MFNGLRMITLSSFPSSFVSAASSELVPSSAFCFFSYREIKGAENQEKCQQGLNMKNTSVTCEKRLTLSFTRSCCKSSLTGRYAAVTHRFCLQQSIT